MISLLRMMLPFQNQEPRLQWWTMSTTRLKTTTLPHPAQRNWMKISHHQTKSGLVCKTNQSVSYPTSTRLLNSWVIFRKNPWSPSEPWNIEEAASNEETYPRQQVQTRRLLKARRLTFWTARTYLARTQHVSQQSQRRCCYRQETQLFQMNLSGKTPLLLLEIPTSKS